MVRTFEELCVMEPSLCDLFDEAKRTRVEMKGTGWHPITIWYDEFKPRMVMLVGMHCGRDDMKSSEDYNTAYAAIQQALLKD